MAFGVAGLGGHHAEHLFQKNMMQNKIWKKIHPFPNGMLTSVVNMHPGVEFTLIRHVVEVAALKEPEWRTISRAGVAFAGPVPATLSQAILSSMLGAEQQ